MLEAPRELLALALLPLNPLEPPPKPPAFDGLLFGMLWLPIRFPPPPLPPRLVVLCPAARLLAPGLAPRFPPPPGCCLVAACFVL